MDIADTLFRPRRVLRDAMDSPVLLSSICGADNPFPLPSGQFARSKHYTG
jgi:hypothetical protein